MTTKICPTCELSFDVNKRNANKKYCSRKCINKGRSHTEEWKLKMSVRNSGANNPFFGKKHTREFIERMSQERSGKSWEERLGEDKAKSLKEQFSLMFSGMSNPFFGKEHSLESRAKISENHRSCSGSLNPMFGQGDKIRGEKNGAWSMD